MARTIVFIFTLEGGPSNLRLGRVLLGCIHAPNRPSIAGNQALEDQHADSL
jgi:hypothetical protein